MPAWIHDRAKHIRSKNPEMDEGASYAIATQQAHRLGKSPKTFKSKVTGKKESFGTPEGRAVAKAKLNKPRKEYKKTASEGTMATDLETNEPSTAGEMPHHGGNHTDHAVNDMGSPTPTNVGAELGALFDNKGETHQGKETTIKNMVNPDTPSVKTAMYDGFFDEFQKIAARTRMFKGAPIGIQKPSGILMRMKKFVTGKAGRTGKGATARAVEAEEKAMRQAFDAKERLRR